MATILETVWEVAENMPFIIDRYREATISLDYYGDSVSNSIMDIMACMAGFAFAYYFRPGKSVALFVVTEVALLLAIRDGLILNIVMLIYPFDALKQWQMG